MLGRSGKGLHPWAWHVPLAAGGTIPKGDCSGLEAQAVPDGRLALSPGYRLCGGGRPVKPGRALTAPQNDPGLGEDA